MRRDYWGIINGSYALLKDVNAVNKVHAPDFNFDGFSTQEIVSQCTELVDKPRSAVKVAVINEAYVETQGDHGWLLDDLNRARDNFKYMELVNLQGA